MAGEYVIELERVDKSFGDQVVLEGVNLSIKSGTTLVIVGASGQGKSVLLKHMLGLMRPDRGVVRVLGCDLATCSRKELNEVRRQFGVLFQNVALFDSMTVFDNVALPLRERTGLSESAIRTQVMDKLKLMGVDSAAQKFPAQISGGMQKRVGLARALVIDPQIVFFDEPTTGLDVHKSNEIYRLFYRAQAELGYTAVIVSHDVPKIFKLADEVALLADRQIQGPLSPEEFQVSTNRHISSFVESTMGSIYTSELEE
ncbi:MAG: ATP-binding cassette domain-containing protein [Deltaproteobacteria bacterium]|nr:MAG: ATP-binding cassette domain-containing protein [Deltaproteobacteria bacterium]